MVIAYFLPSHFFLSAQLVCFISYIKPQRILFMITRVRAYREPLFSCSSVRFACENHAHHTRYRMGTAQASATSLPSHENPQNGTVLRRSVLLIS